MGIGGAAPGSSSALSRGSGFFLYCAVVSSSRIHTHESARGNENTYGLKLRLPPPALDRLAEAHRRALDGLRGVLPRDVFHVRRTVRGRCGDVVELPAQALLVRGEKARIREPTCPLQSFKHFHLVLLLSPSFLA